MKKVICILIAAMLMLLSACSSSGSITPAVYKMNHGFPRVSVRENGTFAIVLSSNYSHMINGTYTVPEENLLKVKSDNGDTYYFEITEDSLIFDGKKSDPIEKMEGDEAEFVDGTEIELWREY